MHRGASSGEADLRPAGPHNRERSVVVATWRRAEVGAPTVTKTSAPASVIQTPAIAPAGKAEAAARCSPQSKHLDGTPSSAWPTPAIFADLVEVSCCCDFAELLLLKTCAKSDQMGRNFGLAS